MYSQVDGLRCTGMYCWSQQLLSLCFFLLPLWFLSRAQISSQNTYSIHCVSMHACTLFWQIFMLQFSFKGNRIQLGRKFDPCCWGLPLFDRGWDRCCSWLKAWVGSVVCHMLASGPSAVNELICIGLMHTCWHTFLFLISSSLVQYYTHDKTDAYRKYCDSLGYLNMAFTVMFSIECGLKMLAFGPKVGWHQSHRIRHFSLGGSPTWQYFQICVNHKFYSNRSCPLVEDVT